MQSEEKLLTPLKNVEARMEHFYWLCPFLYCEAGWPQKSFWTHGFLLPFAGFSK